MFDLAWSEIMLIGAVALVVIGPKELPGAIRSISQFIRKAREMAWEMRGHVDEMVREANLDEVRNQINEIRNFDVKGEVTKTVDPDGSLRRAVTEAGESIQEATRAMDDPDRYPAATAGSAAPAAEGTGTGETGTDVAGDTDAATAEPAAAADTVAEGGATEDTTVADGAMDRPSPEPATATGTEVEEREPAAGPPPSLPEAPDTPGGPAPAAGEAPPAPAPVAPVTPPRPPAPAYEPPAFVPPGTLRN